MDMNIKVSQIGIGQWGKVLIQKFHALTGIHLAYGHKSREELAELNLTFTEDVDELIDASDIVVGVYCGNISSVQTVVERVVADNG